MNGITSMVQAMCDDRPDPPKPTRANGNKTQVLRDFLRRGTATADELSRMSGLPKASISALLGWDIRNGRVLHNGDHYRLAEGYEDDRRITRAIALLRENGYKVTRE